MLFVVYVCGPIDLLTRAFRLKSIARFQTFKNEVYNAWLLVWMHRFVFCTRVYLKRITCQHKFTEHCMASCLDAQFCFLHTRFVKTYYLSAKVYRARYTLHAFLFGCTAFVKTHHLPAQVYRTRYTLHGFLFSFFCLQARF